MMLDTIRDECPRCGEDIRPYGGGLAVVECRACGLTFHRFRAGDLAVPDTAKGKRQEADALVKQAQRLLQYALALTEAATAQEKGRSDEGS